MKDHPAPSRFVSLEELRPLKRRPRRRSRELRALGLACLLLISYVQWRLYTETSSSRSPGITVHGLFVARLEEDLETCTKLHTKPTDPIGLGREKSERYVDGKPPTLIVNATVWTGEPGGLDTSARGDGGLYPWVQADVYLQHGLIKRLEERIPLDSLPGDTLVYDAKGRPLTSGIIDMHSHVGVHSLPTIHSNDDTSELSSDITPYVRAIDGFQPTDRQIQVIKSGGVTTSLVLPGSSNNIGGEAYVVKHAVGAADGRNETSVQDMLADPGRAWRYMKMACGENSKHVHGKAGERGPTSRLGESWEFRRAFERAAALMRRQDEWCAAARLGLGNVETYLPVELEWEGLIAVLRGHVHVNTHCYTINDLEAFVDHSNEFRFPVRAFHHAHQAFLVPEILKRAWGDTPPALALFSDNMWYKAEAYIGSEYAGKILYEQGLTPIYVSDNPVINAQHLILEAAKAHRYGLPYHVALASVTTAPAERLGLGSRLGKVKPGFDADVVVWDSDPLSLGASPVQVWIDGVAQYENPIELEKPVKRLNRPPDQLIETIPAISRLENDLVFTGMTAAWVVDGERDVVAGNQKFNIAVSRGKITCIGQCHAELEAAALCEGCVIPIADGHLTAAFTAFGSGLGLNEIESESVTDNGADGTTFSRGVDGLALNTTKLQVAGRYGVTRAISAPRFLGPGTHHGTSVEFLTGAVTQLDQGAVIHRDAAVHYTLDLSAKRVGNTPSMSAAISVLRDKLLDAVDAMGDQSLGRSERKSEGAFLHKVVAGDLALAITAHSADIIASLLTVKADVEAAIARLGRDSKLRLAIIGGAEAHLVADKLAAAGVGVVLAPMQSYALSWDQRRALTGAPLTEHTAVDVLLRAGVTTALGLEEDWVVRDLGVLAGVAFNNGESRLNETSAFDLVGRNVYELLGLPVPDWKEHFVIHQGNPFETNSRIRAVGDGTGITLLSS